jgi:GNAT superfamily N-acetyltransferase
MEYEIKKIDDSNIKSLKSLADEAKKEGFNFVQRTIDEWTGHDNDFSKPGEILWGAVANGKCVGIGGLNIDPYAGDSKVGRVHHLYISKDFRNKGIATVLLKKIIKRARDFFLTLRVSTHRPGAVNPEADALYESVGFARNEKLKQTHLFDLKIS